MTALFVQERHPDRLGAKHLITDTRQETPMRIVQRAVLTTAVLLAASAGIAGAQSSSAARTDSRFGVRAGLGISPDQFVAGASMTFGKAAGVFRVSPVAQVGFGDDTTFDINVDFLVRLMVENSSFGFYGGAAPTLVFADNTEFGGMIVAGVNVPLFKNNPSAIEGRFGLGDVPDVRILLTVGL